MRRLCIFASLMVVMLSSCEREPQLWLPDEDVQPGSGSVRIATDWSRFIKKETPSGMTLMLFRVGDSITTRSDSMAMTRVTSETTNDITGSNFNLSPSRYAAYVFNQSESEFGTISFSNLSDWRQAQAQIGKVTSKWYTAEKVRSIERELGLSTRSLTDEPLVKSVEWLGTAADDSIMLTQQMLDTAAGRRITIDTLHAENTVYTVTVYVHIKNIGGLRSARASLQGLADSYMLGRHRTSADKATELLEHWDMTLDSTSIDGKTKYGTIKAQIETLGLPYGHQGKADENILHLECLLTNDSILTYNYKVGDRFEYSDDYNVDLNFTIDIVMKDPLPDVPDSGGSSSGFEVTVDDWGEERGVVIPV